MGGHRKDYRIMDLLALSCVFLAAALGYAIPTVTYAIYMYYREK